MARSLFPEPLFTQIYEHNHHSLWMLWTSGGFPSRVVHINNPTSPSPVFDPPHFLYDPNNPSLAIQVYGIAAAPNGLWATPDYHYINTNPYVITLHDKTTGQFESSVSPNMIPTACYDNRKLESDPYTHPGSCLLWCVNQHSATRDAYQLPSNSCCDAQTVLADVNQPVASDGFAVATDCAGKLFYSIAASGLPNDPYGYHLYVMDHPLTGTVTAVYPTHDASGHNFDIYALAEDKGNNVLYGAAADQLTGNVWICTVNPTTGLCTVQFPYHSPGTIVAAPVGLAYDPDPAPTGSLWSCDYGSSTLIHYSLPTGTTTQLTPSPLANFHGLSVSGNRIYASVWNMDRIVLIDKTTGQIGTSFNTLHTFPYDLECDCVTFSPLCALWSVEFTGTSTMQFVAYQIPSGSCICDTGRCCYCDSTGQSQCAMITLAACSYLGGQWDMNLTCATPCSSSCDSGRCCYCDSLGHSQCAMTTQTDCSILNGHWDANLTCADPCPVDTPQVRLVQCIDTLACANSVISPNPVTVWVESQVRDCV